MSEAKTYNNALQLSIFQVIQKAADSLNLETYVIGGYVRDYFLKRGDAKDIDIVAVAAVVPAVPVVAPADHAHLKKKNRFI